MAFNPCLISKTTVPVDVSPDEFLTHSNMDECDDGKAMLVHEFSSRVEIVGHRGKALPTCQAQHQVPRTGLDDRRRQAPIEILPFKRKELQRRFEKIIGARLASRWG